MLMIFHLAKYQQLEVTKEVLLDLSSSFFAGIGAFLNYRTSTDVLQRLELISPASVKLPNGALIDTVPTNNITTQLFHYGIPIELGASIRLSKGCMLQTSLSARCDLSMAFQGYFRQSWSAG